MRIQIYIISLLLFSNVISGQIDEKAIKILDSFSEKATSAPGISMTFDLVTIDQMEDTKDTLKGSVKLSGNKYRLELPENIIISDGQSSWNYLPDEKEVTVTEIEKDDDSFMSRPSSVFSVYKEGYKSRLIEETSTAYIIDLYPDELNSELIRIRLTIGKAHLDLKNLEYKRKDGITAFLNVTEYNLKTKPSAETFTFQKEKYRNVEIIDMR
jgi:outer membrane lipoprotein-sorting protein